jgi:formate/nitrite transporter FocA (FNT family)
MLQEFIFTLNKMNHNISIAVWFSVSHSVGNSIEDTVKDYVWSALEDSVGYSVENFVDNSIWQSVGNSVGNSVIDTTAEYFKRKRLKNE